MNVLWLNFNPDAPHNGYWCTAWLEETLEEFNNIYSPDHIPTGEGAIVVIPAEYNGLRIAEINAVLQEMPWAIVILASDEQGLFPVEELVPVTALWVMTPHFEEHVYPPGTNFMGEFYPPQAREALGRSVRTQGPRKYRAAFSGQVTHQRREELLVAMSGMDDVFFNGTAGFTQGLGHDEYCQLLANTKVAPAPSGPVTLDSFRAFEALEAGAVPVLDLNCPRTQNGVRYWNAVLGAGHPLPMVAHWNELEEIVESISEPRDTNRVFAWWQMYKRSIRHRILADVPGYDHGPVTVLIPTSPIPSHPSTEIIEETVASVRQQHPDAEILIMIDGIRPEQEQYREAYEQYTQTLLGLCNSVWHNVFPMLFDTHHHQANMTRAALAEVKTPMILFVEHDTPLVTDRPFEWKEMYGLIDGNILDMIRFHYAGHIHPEHEYLMLDKIPVNLDGVWLRRTRQWSQRPQLAGTEYYRRIMREHFPPDANTMIEDRIHSIVMNNTDPNQHRVAIYCPQDADGMIIRSVHLDGRGADEKFEMNYGTT